MIKSARRQLSLGQSVSWLGGGDLQIRILCTDRFFNNIVLETELAVGKILKSKKDYGRK